MKNLHSHCIGWGKSSQIGHSLLNSLDKFCKAQLKAHPHLAVHDLNTNQNSLVSFESHEGLSPASIISVLFFRLLLNSSWLTPNTMLMSVEEMLVGPTTTLSTSSLYLQGSTFREGNLMAAKN